MNKRLILAGLTIVAVAGLGVALHLSQEVTYNGQPAFTDAELNARGEALPAESGRTNAPTVANLAPIDLSHPVRLAVGGLGPADESENRALGDLVTVKLTGEHGFELVERQFVSGILRELNLSWSGFVRAGDAVRAGKLLKADWFLLGTEAKINGTNCIVARVVDTRTGVMRDAGVFPAGKSLAELAADLAGFMRQARQDETSPKQRVYLAVGAFEDLSLNNRLADFPTQLRGYLTAAYRGSRVTLLEREYLETLLQEVRLDLAGLTENSWNNSPLAMQSAYWLVTGQFQSYETTNLQVEVTLDVRRVFGKHRRCSLVGTTPETIGKQVKAVIDELMDRNSGILTLTRFSEAHLQMEMGRELLDSDTSFALRGSDVGLVWIDQDWNLDAQLAAKEKRNMEEAIRAFETVLLLEPTNRWAKMCLAACLRRPVTFRPDEARNYYREIIDEPGTDRWTSLAPKALQATFERFWWGGPTLEEEGRWFESAALQATNSVAAEYFRHQAEAAKQNVAIARDASQAQQLAESRLLLNISNSWLGMVTLGVPSSEDAQIGNFVKCFGTNQTAAARRLEELYPTLKTQVPDLAPYLLTQFVTVQVNTNAALVAEFEQMVEKYSLKPDQVYLPEKFWWDIWPAYKWSCEHQLYGAAAKLLEGKLRAGKLYPKNAAGINNTDRLGLAFAYLGAEEWKKALTIFETFSNQPVRMENSGPWGQMFGLTFPGEQAAFCRQKLGLPVVNNPRKFSLGKPVLSLCTPSTFIADDSGLWIGVEGRLLHLDFDLKTNLVANLPMERFTPITALVVTTTNIWLATDGDGLINFDKRTQMCRRFTVKDGLMMDVISSLHLMGDTLWIGYGHRTYVYSGSGASSGGGLGKLDLSASRFVSHTLSLENGPEIHRNPSGNVVPEIGNQPTRRPVLAIAGGAADDVWFVTEDAPTHLRQYRPRENTWTQAMANCSCLVSDKRTLFAGLYWNAFSDAKIGPLGISVLSLSDGQSRNLMAAEGLPSGEVTTLALDGQNLWVGGTGYIALEDPIQGKVLHFSNVNAVAVDCIQIAGGYVWAQYGGHLYRAPLRELQ